MVTFGGRTADQIITEQYAQETGSFAMADPFPVPHNGDPQSLLSQFGDHMLWAEQYLDEMSTLARKQHRLRVKLKDPALQDSPQIGEARNRNKAMTHELHAIACDVATLEAKCDRYWRAMPVDVRSYYCLDFNVQPERKRLIGQAWKVLARQFRWPPNYTFDVGMVRNAPYKIQHDLKRSGTEQWPLGEAKDPFREE